MTSEQSDRRTERVKCSCGYYRLTWEQCPQCGEYGGRAVTREDSSDV